MQAFLIDPLKVGGRVAAQVELVDSHPDHICALLGVGPGSILEAVDLPQSGTLYVAGSAYFDVVRQLGEFRIMKSGGDYRSIAGRGVIVGYAGGASELMDLLASSGVWVSA